MEFFQNKLNVSPYSYFSLSESKRDLSGKISIEISAGEIPNRTHVQKYREFVDIYNHLKMSQKDLDLLKKMDLEFGEIYSLIGLDWNRKVLNLDEERDKFFKSLKSGKRYNPVFKHNPHQYEKNGMLEKAKNLLDRFKLFDCFLSEFYIDILESELIPYGTAMTLDRDTQEYVNMFCSVFPPPSKGLVAKAEEIIKANPFRKVPTSERNIDAKELKSRMDKVLKDLGYDKWKAKIVDTITPRMNVKDEYIVNINKDAKFSEDDFIGLVEHEIKGHVGRRWKGDSIGLMLFRNGLVGKNEFDEGLAIHNSLYKVENPKPNIKFNISFYVLMCNQIPNLDFYSLFKFGKNYIKDSDIELFNRVARMKRICHDTSILVGDLYEIDYLSGFLRVSNMNDAQRDLIHKFNIGLSQYERLDEIRSFLRVNGFIDKNF